jgi:hypothetical protein
VKLGRIRTGNDERLYSLSSMAVRFSHMGNNSIGATTMSSTTADTEKLSVHRTRQVLVNRVTGQVQSQYPKFSVTALIRSSIGQNGIRD